MNRYDIVQEDVKQQYTDDHRGRMRMLTKQINHIVDWQKLSPPLTSATILTGAPGMAQGSQTRTVTLSLGGTVCQPGPQITHRERAGNVRRGDKIK